MTPYQIKEARKTLGLSQRDLAFWLRLSDGRIVRAWEADVDSKAHRDISGPAEVAIEAFLAGYRPTHV